MYDQRSLRSACAYAQSDQILRKSLLYSMTVKLLTEQHLEFLSLKGGCTGLTESTLVEIPHYWKSQVAAHMSSLCTLVILIANRNIPEDLVNIFMAHTLHIEILKQNIPKELQIKRNIGIRLSIDCIHGMIDWLQSLNIF